MRPAVAETSSTRKIARGKRITGYGVPGVDELIPTTRTVPDAPGSKVPHDSFADLERTRKRLRLGRGELTPGQTVNNVMAALSKLSPETEIHLVMPLPPNGTDPNVHIVRTTAKDAGILLDELFHPDGKIAHGIVVPVIRPDGKLDRVIYGAKPTNVPTITKFDPEASHHIFGPLAGTWEETFLTGAQFVQEAGVTHTLLAGESQLKQALKDPRKGHAFKRMLRGSRYRLNDTEAGLTVALFGETPETDPLSLIRQVQRLGDLPEVSMSMGPEGMMIIDAEGNRHIGNILHPLTDHIHTLGAGDGVAGAVEYGRQSGDTLESTLTNAKRQGEMVLRDPSAQGGQMRHDQWIPNAKAKDHEVRYEVYTPRELKRKRRTIS